MTTLLLIETATAVCSVALADEVGIRAELHTSQPNAHSSQLSPYIKQLLDNCGVQPSQLDAVCVSSGPGSYTGLRIVSAQPKASATHSASLCFLCPPCRAWLHNITHSTQTIPASCVL